MKRFPIFKPRTHDFWTENEKERLRRLYADSTLSVHKIAKRMNRTTESVYKKAAELHLYRKGRRRRDNLQHSQHIRPRYDDQDTIVFDDDMLDDERQHTKSARKISQELLERNGWRTFESLAYMRNGWYADYQLAEKRLRIFHNEDEDPVMTLCNCDTTDKLIMAFRCAEIEYRLSDKN